MRLSTAITFVEAPPLELVEATPDSVWFAGPESVPETRFCDGTRPADGLGEALTSEAYLFPFEVRRSEERRRVLAPAGGTQLPLRVPEIWGSWVAVFVFVAT